MLVCAHPLKLGETLLHSDDVMFVFEDKVKLKLQTKYTNKTRYFKDIIHGRIVYMPLK